MADMDFKLNKAGLREIFKSAGMQAALRNEAEKLATKANKVAEAHAKELHIDHFKAPPYGAHVDVLRNTAVGAVHTNHIMGRKDQAKFSTLNSVNH